MNLSCSLILFQFPRLTFLQFQFKKRQFQFYSNSTASRFLKLQLMRYSPVHEYELKLSHEFQFTLKVTQTWLLTVYKECIRRHCSGQTVISRLDWWYELSQVTRPWCSVVWFFAVVSEQKQGVHTGWGLKPNWGQTEARPVPDSLILPSVMFKLGGRCYTNLFVRRERKETILWVYVDPQQQVTNKEQVAVTPPCSLLGVNS